MYHYIQKILFDGVIFGYFLVAALLAAFSPSHEVLMELGRNSLIVLACTVLGLVPALVLHRSKVITLGHVLFAPAHLKAPQGSPRAWFRTVWGGQTIVALLITIALGVVQTGIDLRELFDRNQIGHTMGLLSRIVSPNWAILPEVILKAFETIFMAFMATLIAAPVAFVLSFFCAKNIMGGTPLGLIVYGFLRTFFNVSRSIEALIWAIIFAIWVGFGPFAGMLALMVHSMASLAKQYSELVECVEDGPIEGVRATGAGFLQTIWFSVVPQVILPYISFTIYRWDINVRMATIIGIVGGGGIGELLIQHQRIANWSEVGTIVVVIAIIVLIMDNFSAYVRAAIK